MNKGKKDISMNKGKKSYKKSGLMEGNDPSSSVFVLRMHRCPTWPSIISSLAPRFLRLPGKEITSERGKGKRYQDIETKEKKRFVRINTC